MAVDPKYLIEVTSQPRATADLQMRDPRKPFPPATTILFFTFFDIMNWLGPRVTASSGEIGWLRKAEPSMFVRKQRTSKMSDEVLTSPGARSLDNLFAVFVWTLCALLAWLAGHFVVLAKVHLSFSFTSS
jgi:hypothetical protein